MKRYSLDEATRQSGIDRKFVLHCLRAHWIKPAPPHEALLDEEDLARIQLIHELQQDLGANDQSIHIILHLLDQLYTLMNEVERTRVVPILKLRK
jgi:chaperone modulatory protein CbpM